MSKTPQELGMDYDEKCGVDQLPTLGFLTVWAGPYATVRAAEEARRQYGEGNFYLAGISEIKNSRYVYRVVKP